MKEMQLAYGIGMILPRLAHKNGGLIFTSVEQPYTYPHMYQWTRHSLDFRLNLVFPSPTDPSRITTLTPFSEIPTGTTFQLSICQHNGNRTDYVEWGRMYVCEADWVKIQCSGERPVPLENAMVICLWVEDDETSGQWRFEGFRTDKTSASLITEAIRARLSIQLGITEWELRKWASEIRKSWKKRAAGKKASSSNSCRNNDDNPETK